MKKLNKLQINTEKIMKNEELIIVRGSYDGHHCFCHSCVNDGYMVATSEEYCKSSCNDLGCDYDW